LNLQKLNRLEEALLEYNKLLAFYPADVPTLINKGSVLIALGQREEAKKSWNLALKIEPENQVAMANLRANFGAEIS